MAGPYRLYVDAGLAFEGLLADGVWLLPHAAAPRTAAAVVSVASVLLRCLIVTSVRAMACDADGVGRRRWFALQCRYPRATDARARGTPSRRRHRPRGKAAVVGQSRRGRMRRARGRARDGPRRWP